MKIGVTVMAVSPRRREDRRRFVNSCRGEGDAQLLSFNEARKVRSSTRWTAASFPLVGEEGIRIFFERRLAFRGRLKARFGERGE